jgi:hypothetical protein
MPVLYFKCDEGHEKREITKIDTTGWIKLPNGRSRFNPDAPKIVDVAQTRTCECGKEMTQGPDPKAVNSFLAFNFMED